VKIQIRAPRLKLTKAQRTHAEMQLGLALGRFGDRIGAVVGHFWQETDHGGDPGKRCRIEVALHPRKVCVEEADVDLMIAIDRAAARVSRSVARALERERRLEEQQPQPPRWPS
jgi:ribosome-associated translation inhibitor RaiA